MALDVCILFASITVFPVVNQCTFHLTSTFPTLSNCDIQLPDQPVYCAAHESAHR